MGEELYPLYFDHLYHELFDRSCDNPFWRGMALLGLGRYDEVAEKIDVISDETEKKYLQSRYLYAIGQGQAAFEKSKELLQEDIVDYLRADLYRQVGNIHFSQSQLNQSLIYESKALELFNNLGLYAAKYACVNNLGIMYASKGDYDKAIEFYEETLNFYKENVTKRPNLYRRSIIITSMNLNSAKIDAQASENILLDMKLLVDMARDYWMVDKENQDALHIYSSCLNNLIYALIKKDNIPEAEHYLNIIQSLPQDYYRVKVNVLTSTAALLMESHRLRDHFKAEEILQNIIHDPQIDFQDLYYARNMLFKILLDEFQQTGEQEVLDEIIYHLERQMEIAIIENIPIHRLEVQLIRARICVIKSNLDNALSLIDQVREEASSLGITRIYDEAMKDRQYVENEIQSLIQGSQKYQTLAHTIHTEKLQNYIRMVKEQLSH